jgi:penicillin-binding protein 2
MSSSTDTTPTLRLTMLLGVVVLLLLALASRLWFLQVLAGERYAVLADSNRVRIVYTEAPRGRILAADGAELVKNRPAQTVSADPRVLLDGNGEPRDEQAEATLADLSALLGMPEDEIVERLLSRRYSPFRAVPIKEDVPAEVVFYIRENQEFFQGVVAETLPVRTYPNGTTAAHILGYLGEINTDELARDEFRDYRAGELIGKAGLELSYEHDLQGEEGFRRLEVNARGTVLNVLEEQPPTRGDDVVTSIDLELQMATERILEEGIVASRLIQRDDGRFLPSVAGSAVVLDPRDGSVVAMASYPTYDPSAFADGLSEEEFAYIFDLERKHEVPALNRAVQGVYPPGSVFKTVTGAAYLEAGLVTPSTPIACPPSFTLGNVTFRNWNPRNEGSLDLPDAIMRSCDTYFYDLAWKQYQREESQLDSSGSVDELLPRISEGFGFGRALGIDLPVEYDGTIPGRDWKRDFWKRTRDDNCALAEEAAVGTYAKRLYTELCTEGYRWRGGDAVNSSIGQGDVLVTPLQVAASYAAIANGGTLHRPRIAQQIVDASGQVVRTVEPEALNRLPVDDAGLAALRQGLEQVVMAERGTARGAFTGFPLDRIPVAGKTGTAELKPKVPFAWFAAYAPSDEPRYVVVVSVEEGGGGSQTAAPIARRILEHAFGLEVSPFQAGPANVD